MSLRMFVRAWSTRNDLRDLVECLLHIRTSFVYRVEVFAWLEAEPGPSMIRNLTPPLLPVFFLTIAMQKDEDDTDFEEQLLRPRTHGEASTTIREHSRTHGRKR
jgi:hypothetical protein